MKFRSTVLAMMLVACASAAAAPRIATVRVADVYKRLETTRQQQQEIQEKREAILKDRRLEELNKMISNLEARRQQFSSMDPQARTRAEREYAVKHQEARTLQEDFASYRTQKNREINGELVAGMQASLERIRETAVKLGKEEGFDWVIDTSGNTNTGLPLVLYAKNPADLTERVAIALGAAPEEATSSDR